MSTSITQNGMVTLLEIYNNETIKKIGSILNLGRNCGCRDVQEIGNSEKELEIIKIIIRALNVIRSSVDFCIISDEEVIDINEKDIQDLLEILSKNTYFDLIKISLELHSLSK